MNELDLKQLWQQQTLGFPSRVSNEELVRQMKRKMKRFDRTIFWRDVRETGACVVLIILSGRTLLHRAPVLVHAGNLVIILACLFIAVKLTVARRAQHAWLNPRSVRDFLVGEAAKVERQIHLLQTVLWWYILPLFFGATLAALGSTPGRLFPKLLLLLSFILVGWFIRWLNQYAVRKSLLPLKNELTKSLNSVPEFSEQEKPHNPEGQAL